MEKAYNLMTPEERTASRIAKNRVISDKIAENQAANPPKAKATRASAAKTTTPRTPKATKPPVASTSDFTRASPDEHVGGVIRKLTR